MTQKFSIRIATQADAYTIADIYLISRKTYVSFAPLIHSDTAIKHWIQDILIPSAQVFVVEKDEIMVGMMAIIEKQKINWIDQLYILPPHTGQGIGSLLISKVKSLPLPIRLHTFQENLSARRFYDRHGFKILAFSDGSENEEHCPDMLYEWRP